MIEKIIACDSFLRSINSNNNDNLDRLIFYTFLKKYNKLPDIEKEKKLGIIIDNLYKSFISNDCSLNKYCFDFFNSGTIYFDRDSLLGIKNSSYFDSNDKEVLLKILLLENICRMYSCKGMLIEDTLYMENSFSNMFDMFLNKSDNPLKIMYFLYNDFYYINSNIEYHFRSKITDCFSMMYVLKNPDKIKDKLNNNKYRSMICSLIQDYFGYYYGSFDMIPSFIRGIYYNNINNFCNVVDDNDIISRFFDEELLKNRNIDINNVEMGNSFRRFQPDDSGKGFNFGGYRSLISIEEDGNEEIHYNTDHYALVRATYHLCGRENDNNYFETLLFEASRGYITIITEGSSAYVYLPEFLTRLQVEKIIKLLDDFGVSDLNADFRICRVLVTNDNCSNLDYNGENIPFECYEEDGNDVYKYSDFLRIIKGIIDETKKSLNSSNDKQHNIRRHIRKYLYSEYD